MKSCAGNNQPQKQTSGHLIRWRWQSASNKKMLAFLRTIPAYVFGNFGNKQMLFCTLQYPLEVIQILKPKFLGFFSQKHNCSVSYRLARDWSGVTAQATEAQDCISTPVLVPDIQYNLERANQDHCLLEQVALSSALISEYLFWDTFCLVLFHNNCKNLIFTVTFKRLPPKLLGKKATFTLLFT